DVLEPLAVRIWNASCEAPDSISFRGRHAMMRSMLSCLVVGLVGIAAWASPAFATAISADGTFHEFFWRDAPPSPVVSCLILPGIFCSQLTVNPVAEQSSSPPWTFTGAASIFVQDLFTRGDRFQVFDNAGSLGMTSVPINDEVTC